VKKTQWLWFSLIRLAAFAIPLLITLALGIVPWLAALLSAIIGFCISYIFFARRRNELSTTMYQKRAAKAAASADKDAEAEDAEVENLLAEEGKGQA
jgi:hypothetical protein